MAASFYLVRLPEGAATVVNRVTMCIVTAESADDARAAADSRYGRDGSRWNHPDVLVEAITSQAMSGDLEGWSLSVEIYDTDYEATVTAAASDTLDDLADAMAAALVALGIATAAYDDTTQVLTVAGAAANLGDKTLIVKIIPPGGTKSVDGLIASKVDEGAAGDALSVTLVADTYTLPEVHVAGTYQPE